VYVRSIWHTPGRKEQAAGKLVVVNSVSLDGVTQAPGAPDKDRRSDFEYGEWTVPYSDEVLSRKIGESDEQAVGIGSRAG
jgi:hypothetical protein